MDDDHFSRRSSVLKGDLPEGTNFQNSEIFLAIFQKIFRNYFIKRSWKFGKDFASMETERILMYQREDNEDYGNIDTDRTVQGFKASLRVLLADERLRHRKSFNF